MTTKEKIQKELDKLMGVCLEKRGVHQKFNDKDLMNATFIFSHILLDVAYTESQTLSKEKKLELAETMGMAVRELIKVSTGKDMHDVTKKIMEKNNE